MPVGTPPALFTTMIDSLPVSVYASNLQAGQAAAAKAALFLQQTLKTHGRANIILATGNSQLSFLETLSSIPELDWSKVNIFHMDEYLGLDASHPASFPRFLRRHFLDHLRPSAGNFSRFPDNIPTWTRPAMNTRLCCAPTRLICARSGLVKMGTWPLTIRLMQISTTRSG